MNKYFFIFILFITLKIDFYGQLSKTQEKIVQEISILNLGDLKGVNISEKRNKLIFSSPNITIEKAFIGYRIKENTEHIYSLLDQLKLINQIKEELTILEVFSQEKFYTSFSKCGCTKSPYNISLIYKNSWKIVKEKILTISISSPINRNQDTEEIFDQLVSLKEGLDSVNDDLINTDIDSNNHDNVNSFVTQEAIPKNANQMKNLSLTIEELENSILTFLIYVRFFNPNLFKK